MHNNKLLKNKFSDTDYEMKKKVLIKIDLRNNVRKRKSVRRYLFVLMQQCNERFKKSK